MRNVSRYRELNFVNLLFVWFCNLACGSELDNEKAMVAKNVAQLQTKIATMQPNSELCCCASDENRGFLRPCHFLHTTLAIFSHLRFGSQSPLSIQLLLHGQAGMDPREVAEALRLPPMTICARLNAVNAKHKVGILFRVITCWHESTCQK